MPRLSQRTQKQIAKLPEHAKHIFKKSYNNALKEYRDPKKRRGGKKETLEEVAHKIAWSAIKKSYKKKEDAWIRR
jgi:cation transport regulator